MKSMLVLAMSLALFVVQPALAAEKVEPAVNASTKAAFDTVSDWVRKQMDAGGRYAETNAGERARVNARLDEMGKLFQTHGEVAQMSSDDKLRLFNGQEEVNAILGKRDGQRLICKNERPVGSNIPVKTCQTAAQIEERRRGDVKDFRQRQDVQGQLKGGS